MFSIATISFNQGRFLEQAIRSVVEQKSDADEYLVFDGGSKDDSQQIIERYADQLTQWRSGPDGGPAAALNDALAAASNPFFLYINADDFLLPGSLSRLRAYLSARERRSQSGWSDVYYGNGITLHEERRLYRRRYSDRWDLIRYARGRCSVVQQSTVLQTAKAVAAGGFSRENRTCWDGELLFKMARSGCRFERLPFSLGVFRIHGESITGSGANAAGYFADRQRMATQVGVEYRSPDGRGPVNRLGDWLRYPDQGLGRVTCRLLDVVAPLRMSAINDT